MTDADSLGMLVTKFLLDTCRLCPPPSRSAIDAVMLCARWATERPDDEPEADFVSLITGSVTELYVEPMLSCIGDIDLMFHRSTWLAIPAGHPRPTQLPADFHSNVRLLEVVSSAWPGYVYLLLIGLLSRRVDDDRYTFWSSEEKMYAASDFVGSDVNTHGPAQTIVLKTRLNSQRMSADSQPVDNVYCVRCLVWPPQAADWATRRRKYGWPDSATVDRVVGNGCDVVPVAHRQCRQHEWEGRRQWRLSFSRAEVVLLNSWMPAQQIVYHMLRVFGKTERLTDSVDNSGVKLSNYHIKTLMLWACELKPRDWWTCSSSYVRICITLLHTLAVWIRDAHCLQYFVNRCNLLDHDISNVKSDGLLLELLSIDERWLSKWFLDNYLLKCADVCPTNMFNDVTTNAKLDSAVSAIADRRHHTFLENCFETFCGTARGTAIAVHDYSLTVGSVRFWFGEFEKLDPNQVAHFIAVAFLHIARLMAAGEQRCYEFLEILATICLYLSGIKERHSYTPRNLIQLFKRAMLFLQLASNISCRTLELIQIELSKAYLHRLLECEVSALGLHHDYYSLEDVSKVYLAALNFATGQHQTAAEHCALLTTLSDYSRCCSHVVEGQLLPKIDDDVDIAFSLPALYQFVRISVISDTHHVSVFDIKSFAHYLQVKCRLSASTCSAKTLPEKKAFLQYHNCVHELQELFITDVLLFKRLKKRFLQGEIVEQEEHETVIRTPKILVDLLLQSAVEHLTLYRQLEARDFGSVAAIVTTDFEALYAYKCGEYKHCFRLCRQNVHALINAVHMSDVFTYPEFIQLMDGDIVLLVGLTLAVNRDAEMRIFLLPASLS